MIIKRNYKDTKNFIKYFDSFVNNRLNMETLFIDLDSKKLELKDINSLYNTKTFLKTVRIGLITKPSIIKDLQSCGYDYDRLRSIFFKIRGIFKMAGYDLICETKKINELIQNYKIK